MFLPNAQGGLVFATGVPPQEKPTFRLNQAVTQMAERAGFDFVLSQSKWRGYGGASGHFDTSLESFTLMAALAAVTSRIQLFASVGVRTIHPVIAAKMAATLDDISAGRFGLNIVAGWNQAEYGQMGLWADDDYHRYRYAYAEEYLAVLRKLWSAGTATHHGRFFQLDDCQSWPKPGRALPVVCAGQSDDALAFTARHAEFSFVGRQADTPAALAALTRKLTALAAAEGRTVGAYMLLTVIARGTRAAAEAERDHYVAHADDRGLAEWARVTGLDPNKASYADLRTVQRVFSGMPLVVGSYAEVASYLDEVASAGLRGACLVFPDYAPDLCRFIAEVVPLMAGRVLPPAPSPPHS